MRIYLEKGGLHRLRWGQKAWWLELGTTGHRNRDVILVEKQEGQTLALVLGTGRKEGMARVPHWMQRVYVGG